MAVLGSFEVIIVVDGEPCTEYVDHEVEETATFTSTYIQAAPGAHFDIQLEIMPGFDFEKANYLRWEIFLDGNSITKPVCYEWAYRKQGYWQDSRGGVREKDGERWVEKKFFFGNAPIRETEDGDTDEHINALSQILGTVRVVLHRRVGGEKPGLERRPAQARAEVPKKAVETSIITLSSRLDAGEPTTAPEYCEGEDVDAEPVADLVFKYRTKDALMELLGGRHSLEDLEDLEDSEVEVTGSQPVQRISRPEAHDVIDLTD